MFSGFGSIFGIMPRRAESTDTRQAIRRHDPDQEHPQRKNNEKEKPPAPDAYDNASVSIESLEIFLENFLKSLQTGTDTKTTLENQQQIPASHPAESALTPSTTKASVAANAYQSTQEHIRHTDNAQTPPPASKQILENEEIRTIHQLLKDIALLKQNGVKVLVLEKDITFLAALVKSVRTALQS